MKKSMCELCNKKATLHCESDQARLCWECDEKVHGANFLVAKHCRSLLCHACQKPTPWKASGPKLSQTISVCVSCSDNKNSRIQQDEDEEEEINQPQLGNQETESEDDDDGNQESSSSEDEEEEEEDDEDEDEDEDDEEEEEEDEEDDDGENQVVPWSASPPIASSSSCSDEGVAVDVSSTLKRIRENEYLESIGSERSLHQICGMSSLSSLRPWKVARNGDSS